jgi:hypothetical protein
MEILMCQIKSLISTPLVRGIDATELTRLGACDGPTNRDKQRHKASIPFLNAFVEASPTKDDE